ncbi:hypothetical protein J5N97_013157 [Dioscorea zingiberensis]|uniref:Pentatricopeptide repeat-containing protein n=1 Tax=Dioscorea zingiberensis TaxID=325984 RepID=A0A9D5CQP9_9LILI|nr:hypothetical protein J5N97_013157 [Dioscorea zingiberensis]
MQIMQTLIKKARAELISILDSTSTVLHLHQLLARAITTGLWHDPFVAARLVASCASSSDLGLTQLAFDSSPNPTAFSFNSIIRAHSSGPSPSLSLILFHRMLRRGLHPDRFSFPFLLRAAARTGIDLNLAHALHALALRHGVAQDPFVATSLLHAYASFNVMDSALQVFDEMPLRTIVTWNAIISCCSKSARQLHGLSLFNTLLLSRQDDVRVNADTLVAALSCCKGISALTHGKSVHALAIRMHLINTLLELGTSLVHMYVKCGGLEYGRKVFDEMPDRDTSAWTAMIGGLALHGRGDEAAGLFKQMKVSNILPDSMTFTSVLHACSHCGLVGMGMSIFNEMRERKELRMEHYGAMVDMLGRAGRLDEAEKFIERMPLEPSGVVWGSLLHASVMNGEVELGEKCVKLGLGEDGGGGGGSFLVGASNVYARDGRWDEVGRVRERMVEKGVRKQKGLSLVL